MSAQLEPRPLAVERQGITLAGETVGDGAPIVLLHGLTASRRYVVHGSRQLPRRGYRTVAYDARGHGESEPAPPDHGYSYAELAADLDSILGRVVGEGRCVLAGHSMGAHTIATHVLAKPDRVAAVVLIGPAVIGGAVPDEVLAEWDALADGLERGGVEGFVDVYARSLDPAWRDTLLRITRARLALHRHPDGVVRALREVPRSQPFEDLGELEFVELPALVVASHDEADPSHPYAVAEAWAERLPQARLISEPQGASPLAWQGGRLSREIAAFCEQPAVADRLAG